MTTRRTGSRPRWSHGARPIRTRTSPAQGRAARLDVRAVSFIHWQVRLALVSPARGKHDFFLTEQPLMSGIHHLEYLGLIRDEFVMRHRAVAIRVDLEHHFMGPKSTSVAACCERPHIVRRRT